MPVKNYELMIKNGLERFYFDFHNFRAFVFGIVILRNRVFGVCYFSYFSGLYIEYKSFFGRTLLVTTCEFHSISKSIVRI